MIKEKLTERNAITSANGDDYIHIVQGNISYKIKKSDLQKDLTTGYQGGLAIADTPSADGFYFATETGTYTNAGSLVTDLSNGINIINVSDTQTTFSLTVVDPNIVPIGVVEADNSEAVSGDAVNNVTKYKSTLVIGKNKLNYDAITQDLNIDASGNITSDTGKQLTEYIPVLPSTQYVTNQQMRSWCYFDTDKSVVSGGSNTAGTTFTTSSSTYFVRITFEDYYINTFDIQLEVGSSATTFEAYEAKTDYQDLPVPKATFDNTNTGEYVSGKAIDEHYLNPDINIFTYTEDFSNSRYNSVSSTKDTSTVLEYKGVDLTKLTGTSFYSAINTNLSGLGLTILETGEKYFMSYYILSLNNDEQFIWMKYLANSSSNAHAPKLIDGRVRRVWQLVEATSTTQVDALEDPTTNYGDNSRNPFWFTWADSNAFDVRIGGFQLEKLDDNTYVDGVALIGDSTMAGSSGEYDRYDSKEVSTYAAALLNVTFLNRATGGERTDQMDARWATDITPISHNCKYCIIQGGINDISQSRAIADIKTSISSMVSKAETDGMIPIVMNCTPFGATGSQETDRLSLNEWIHDTFELTLDIASIVCDPSDVSTLRSEFQTDSVHYNEAGKRAIGTMLAQWQFWDFKKPKPYQQVLTTSKTVENPFDRKIGEIKDLQPLSVFYGNNDLSTRHELI